MRCRSDFLRRDRKQKMKDRPLGGAQNSKSVECPYCMWNGRQRSFKAHWNEKHARPRAAQPTPAPKEQSGDEN